MRRIALICLDWGYWGGEEIFTYTLARLMKSMGIEVGLFFPVLSMAKKQPETFKGERILWKDLEVLTNVFDEFWVTTGDSYRERHGKDSPKRMKRLYDKLFVLKPMKIFMHRRHYFEKAQETLYSNKEVTILTQSGENVKFLRELGFHAEYLPLLYYPSCHWHGSSEAVLHKEARCVFATRLAYDKRLRYFLKLFRTAGKCLTTYGHTYGWERNLYLLQKEFSDWVHSGAFKPEDAEKVYGKHFFCVDGSKYGDNSGMQYSFLMALDWYCIPVAFRDWHCECFKQNVNFIPLTLDLENDLKNVIPRLEYNNWKMLVERRDKVLEHHNAENNKALVEVLIE